MYKVLCGMHTGFLVLWGIPRSEIDGSEDNSVYLSEELLNCLVSASFYNPTSNVRVPISPYPHQQLLLPLFLTIAIPVCVKWYLIVILICISLMTNDTEHLFMCLLAICIFSLEKCLFKAFDNFFFWLCCATCGILIPRPGFELTPPAVEVGSLNHWTAGDVLDNFLISCFCCCC